MATLQERLNIKRAPIDTWTIKEKLFLALAVLRNGDQNWMSVSRSLKAYQDINRPTDWFSTRNCAQQYGLMLENVETPKRKKRTSVSLLSTTASPNLSTNVTNESQMGDIPGEYIVRKLTAERIEELQKSINDKKIEYKSLRNEIQLLESGQITEAQLRKMYQEIQGEERLKEDHALEHIKWLNARENKKLELEMAWRPVVKIPPNSTTKRKLSEIDRVERQSTISKKETSDNDLLKPPLLSDQMLVPVTTTQSSTVSSSPLLSSLLKSPTSAANFHSNLFNTLLEKDTSLTEHVPLTKTSFIHNSIRPIVSADKIPSSIPSSVTVHPSLVTSSPVTITQSEIPTVATTLVSVTNVTSSIARSLITSTTTPSIETVLAPVTEIMVPTTLELSTTMAAISTTPAEIKTTTTNTIVESQVMEQQLKLEELQEIVTVEIEQIEMDQEEEDDDNIKLKEFCTDEELKPISDDVKEESQIEHIELEANLETESKNETAIANESTNVIESIKMEQEEHIEEKQKQEQEQEQKQNDEVVDTNLIVNKNDDHESQMIIVNDTVKEDKNIDTSDNVINEKNNAINDQKIEIKEENEVKCEKISSEIIDKSHEEIKSNKIEEIDDSVAHEIFKPTKVKRDYTRNSKLNRKSDYDYEIILMSDEDDEESTNDSIIIKSANKKKFSSDDKNVLSKGSTKLQDKMSSSSLGDHGSPWTDDEISVKSVLQKRLTSKKRRSIETISNSPSPVPSSDDDRDSRALRKSHLLLYNRIVSHKHSNHFLKPITDELAPNYSEIIKQPIDLLTIKKNIDNGSIKSISEFQRDILLMFNNAFIYNDPQSYIFYEAVQMQKDCLDMFRQFIESQSNSDVPRRETRKSLKPTFKCRK